MIDLSSRHSEFDAIVDHVMEEFKHMRTGRAHAGIVEHILVDSYGTLTPIKHLATIAIPDQRTILISPWDRAVLKEIEKGIVNANIGVAPVNDGASVRVSLPTLTEENRKALVKAARQRQEQARVALRLLRDKIREEIQKEEKNKEITEDDRFAFQKDLDEMTKEYSARVDSAADEKEKEIMTL